MSFNLTLSYQFTNISNLLCYAEGVLIHTSEKRGKKAHAYVDLLQCPHDSNLTMSIVLDVIVNHCKGVGHIPNVNDKWPSNI